MIFRSFVILVCISLAGCSSIGPHQVKLDRNRYNDVIQQTNNEQLLMNIVRLRYVEPVTNLKLTNVTSSYTFNSSITTAGTGLSFINASASAPGGAGPSQTKTLNIDPGVQYSDTPTISYAPVENSVFAEEMMSPLKLYKVHLLAYGGISDTQLVMRLVFQNINDMDNASSASSEKMRALPDYKKYYRFVDKLSYLIDNNEAYFRLKKINGNSVWSIYFPPKYSHTQKADEIRNLLHVKNNTKNEIILSDVYLDKKQDNLVFVRMRSLYGMMIFLSYGVQIPESDIEKHYVYTYYNADGTPYDWAPLTKGLLTVYSSDTEPKDVFVKTMSHGHWFYIENSDLDSKATFLLLVRLIALSSAALDKLGGAGPLLTLPAR